MLKRMIGVLILRPAVYLEIAKDTTATGQAAVIIAAALFIQGVIEGLIQAKDQTGVLTPSPAHLIGSAFAVLISGLIAWVITAWFLTIAARLLGGRTNTGEMLRVTGYVEIFTIVIILSIPGLAVPALSFLVDVFAVIGALLGLLGYLIGVSESADLSIRRAFVASSAAGIINLLIVVFLADMTLRVLRIW
jgi:hypothetical protein